LLGVDLKAETVLLLHSGEELGVTGLPRVRGLHHLHVQVADAVLSHLANGRRLEDLVAVKPAVVEEHLQELHVVVGRRIQAVPCEDVLRIRYPIEVDWRDRAVGSPGVHGHE
jgi:hypothetical protein